MYKKCYKQIDKGLRSEIKSYFNKMMTEYEDNENVSEDEDNQDQGNKSSRERAKEDTENLLIQVSDSLIDLSLNFNNVGFINHSSFGTPNADQDKRKEIIDIKIALEKQRISELTINKVKSGSNDVMLQDLLKHPCMMFNHIFIEES